MPLNNQIGRLVEESTPQPTDEIVLYRNGVAYRSSYPNANGTFENTVIVKEASDLENIDSTKNYMIDGVVDMGTTQIVVPEGGLSISGLNGSRDTSKLISSSDNYKMFVTSTFSGDVVIETCSIEVTGSNSQVFDLDNSNNFNALDIFNVNFNNCTSLGELSNYRQILLNNVGFILLQDGLTFNGTWIGIAVTTTIAIVFPAAATLFKVGTGFTTTNFRSDINFLSTDTTSVLCDFAPSNITTDGGMALDNVRTNATNPLPNITGADVQARFRNCVGFRNTYIGGFWEITSETTTTIPGANTPVLLAGTTTYDDLNHFSTNGNNSFVYDGSQNIEVEIRGVISLDGGNNDQIFSFFRKWDDSAGSYVDLTGTQATLNGGIFQTRGEAIAIFAQTDMDENDRIELWVENLTDGTNVTGLGGGFVSVSERTS